jgi:hypothetical protein
MPRTIRLDLPPYRPDHLCPRCGSEGARPTRHRLPVLAVFGTGPPWPCTPWAVGGALGEHLCSRCEHCGYAWMEAAAPETGQPLME